MLSLNLVRSRRMTFVVGAVVVASLAYAQIKYVRAYAQGVSRTNTLIQMLVDSAPRHVPKGYSSANASRVTLNDNDRRSGMVAAVQVALGGGDPKGSLRYGLFQSEKEAKAFTADLSQRRPRGSSIKFLQYMPNADCADTPNGGLCSLLVGNVVIVATASQVDRGASLVMIAAKEAIEVATTSQRSSPSTTATAPKSATTSSSDGCALFTKADAAAALGGPVADPRQSGDTCYYGLQAIARDSVTLQLIEGGRSKFDFDRGRIQRTVRLSGIGDDAFVFVSEAGFVQLYFIKGTRYAALTLQTSRDVNRLESTKALARKIAARL